MSGGGLSLQKKHVSDELDPWQQTQQSAMDDDKSLLMAWDGFLGFSQFTWNLSFVFLVVLGQVGQNVTLPIWFSSTPLTPSGPAPMDPLFILTFAGLCFVMIFGSFTLLDIYNDKTSFAECRLFTNWSFVARYWSIGVCNALNGIFLVFAANPTRTPPYLQSILGTFNIGWTIIFRFLILRKAPSRIQAFFAVGVFIGLFMASAPVIFDMNSGSSFKSKAPGIWKWLWPLIFGGSFAPAAIMNVVGEHVLKETSESQIDYRDSRAQNQKAVNVNVWYYLTMQSLAQEVTFFALFWVDCVPTFGTVSTVSEVFQNMKQDWRYFFGMDGADISCTVRALVFIACYTFNYIGSSLMLRYTEGATWTAVVGALVTPFGAIFWILFCLGGEFDTIFQFKWQWESSDWLVLAGLAVMSIFIFFYNLYSSKDTEAQKLRDEMYGYSDVTPQNNTQKVLL